MFKIYRIIEFRLTLSSLFYSVFYGRKTKQNTEFYRDFFFYKGLGGYCNEKYDGSIINVGVKPTDIANKK